MPWESPSACAFVFPRIIVSQERRAAVAGLYRRAVAAYLSDVGKRVIDRTLFRLALMLFEIGLKLLFTLDGIGYEFPLRAEG